MRLFRRAGSISFSLLLVNFVIQTNFINAPASEDFIDRPLSNFAVEPLKVSNATKIDGLLEEESWRK